MTSKMTLSVCINIHTDIHTYIHTSWLQNWCWVVCRHFDSCSDENSDMHRRLSPQCTRLNHAHSGVVRGQLFGWMNENSVRVKVRVSVNMNVSVKREHEREVRVDVPLSQSPRILFAAPHGPVCYGHTLEWAAFLRPFLCLLAGKIRLWRAWPISWLYWKASKPAARE